MSDVTPQRINIQNEETVYRGSVSEALLRRVGASTNFINERQYMERAFFINGPYRTATAVDGAISFAFDAEIVYVAMFNIEAGSAGTLTMDVRKYTASNTPAGGSSIFSTKPSIDFSAGNVAYVSRRIVPSDIILENPSGTTAPVLGTTTVDAGDLLTVNIDAVQTGGRNCGLILGLRPR